MLLRPGSLPGKGRAVFAARNVAKHDLLLVEAPLLCVALPGARHACGVCLGDADVAAYCEACKEGFCTPCGASHLQCCPRPDDGELELRSSLWYGLYNRYVELLLKEGEGEGDDASGGVDWDDFARVPTSIYGEGWEKFAAAADLFVAPVQRRCGARAAPGSRASQALSAHGFLDFYRLARANAAEVSGWGSGIFRLHAQLNHACEPNAVVLRLLDLGPGAKGLAPHQGSIVVLATRSIAEGEEVCINYRLEGESREELEERYGFVCLCQACAARGTAPAEVGGSGAPPPLSAGEG